MFHVSWRYVDEKPLASFSTLSAAIDYYVRMVSIMANEAPWQNDKFCVTDDCGRIVYL